MPVGPGPRFPSSPQGPPSGAPAGPSEDSECTLLPPPRLLPREGTGPLSRPKLLIGSSASPQPRPDGCSILLGPTPQPPVPDPNRKVVPVPDETTLCPRFRLSQSPTPGVLPHRECVLKNEFANKPTNPTLQKNKTLIFFSLCQKLWTCWLSILRTKLLLNFNLLLFFFY